LKKPPPPKPKPELKRGGDLDDDAIPF